MPQKNWLLVIGIDQYSTSMWKPLDNAVADANRIRDVLRDRYGFEVYNEFYDEKATYRNITEAILSLPDSMTEEDNLLIYFAGHGQMQKSSIGYWVPADVTDDFLSTYVPNGLIVDIVSKIAAKHVLLVSDSCFAGTFLPATRGSSPIDYDEMEALNSRWVMTSIGKARVSDGFAGKGSPFSSAMFEYLQKNVSPAFGVKDLFNEIKTRTLARSKVDPQLAEYDGPNHDSGQMVFRLISRESTDRAMAQKQDFSLPNFPKNEFYIPRTIQLYNPQKDYPWFSQPERERGYIEEFLLDNKRIVLLGSAGSGKSIELIELAKRLKQPKSPYIPIYKKFNTYIQEDIEAYLPGGWKSVNPDRLVVILDGLDEVQPQFFNTALRKIIAFSEQYHQIRLIISCRTNFYELPYGTFTGTLEEFTVYTLNDISLPEINKYATDNFKMDGTKFLHDAYHRSLSDLLHKPYFLNLLLKHYATKWAFTASRADILKESLFTQFSDNHQHYKSTTEKPLTQEKMLDIMESIALVMEMIGKNLISDTELQKILLNSSDYESTRYLPAFTHDDQTNNWRFDHNNIQEYLAARVLSSQPFDQLIQTISFSPSNKVKPNWANTISFFISIAPDEVRLPLLDWLKKHDAEFIIKFERERVPKETRIQVAKDIFDFYSDQGVWLTSNKFTEVDLARFGEEAEVVDYLVGIVNSQDTGRIAKLNAIHVLNYMHIQDYPAVSTPLLNAMVRILNDDHPDHYYVQSILRSLGELRLADPTTVDYIVSKYRKHTNQHIRAGLYKFIKDSGQLDEYLDVYLDGLNLSAMKGAIDDRDEVNLMDEGFHLGEGLKSVETTVSIKRLLTFFTDLSIRRRFYEFDEVLKVLVNNLVKNYQDDPSLYLTSLEFFRSTVNGFDQGLATVIWTFFKRTGNAWRAFHEIWDTPSLDSYTRTIFITTMMDEEVLEWFVMGYRDGIMKDVDVSLLFELLLRNETQIRGGTGFIDRLQKEVASINNFSLNRPIYPDWAAINQQKAQESFDLLFDKVAFVTNIEKIYAHIGKDPITLDDLYPIRSEPYGAESFEFNKAAQDFLREVQVHHAARSKGAVLSIIENNGFYYYRGMEIYQMLKRGYGEGLKISSQQEEFIADWCKAMVANENFREKVKTGAGHIPVIWYFITRFNIGLSKDKLLDFTQLYKYSNQVNIGDNNTIDELENLEPRIGKSQIALRVIENLRDHSTPSISWQNNASYAIRKGIRAADDPIKNYLLVADDHEYRLGDFLEFWYSQTGDHSQLKILAEKAVSYSIREKAIVLLRTIASERIFTVDYLYRNIKGENVERGFRYFSAGEMMHYDELAGLEFIVDSLLNGAEGNLRSLSRISSITALRTAKAVPLLIQLVLFCKENPPIDHHPSFFEAKVMDAIYNIGVESEAGFQTVKTALEQFIMDYSDKFDNLNFLNLNILRMEEQILLKKSKSYTLNEAILVLHKLKHE